MSVFAEKYNFVSIVLLFLGAPDRCIAMKKYILFLFAVSAFLSCGGGVYDARIDAYSAAIANVGKATSSTELVDIAYRLDNSLDSLEGVLVSIDELHKRAADGDDDSRELLDSINAARTRYVDALSRREIQFYIDKAGKRR